MVARAFARLGGGTVGARSTSSRGVHRSHTGYPCMAGPYLRSGEVAGTLMECVDVSSVVIFQPTQLGNTMNYTNTSTVGGSNGSATANASGGTLPYSYLWSNGETTSAIFGLSAGNNTVTVTEGGGCKNEVGIPGSPPGYLFRERRFLETSLRAGRY